MNDEAANGRDCIVNGDVRVAENERARVADLPARFSVEGRAIQNGLAVFALAQFIHFIFAVDECQDTRAFSARLFIARKLAASDTLRDARINGLSFRLRRALIALARALNLAQRSFKRSVEALFVKTKAALFHADANQIAWRAEGVVEPGEVFVVWKRARVGDRKEG